MSKGPYTWSPRDGLCDADGHQVLQLVGSSRKFRDRAGRLLAEALNRAETAAEAPGAAIPPKRGTSVAEG